MRMKATARAITRRTPRDRIASKISIHIETIPPREIIRREEQEHTHRTPYSISRRRVFVNTVSY